MNRSSIYKCYFDLLALKEMRNIMRVITLGEILLRLSTKQDTRLKYADFFKSGYGGGEANVGISLSIFGHEVSIATILPQDNPLSESVLSVLRKSLYFFFISPILCGNRALLGCIIYLYNSKE